MTTMAFTRVPTKLLPVDLTKPVQTKVDGFPVRLVCFDVKNLLGYHIIGLCDTGENECVLAFKSDGSCSSGAGYNLVNAPFKTSTYQNVYKSSSSGASEYQTLLEATRNCGSSIDKRIGVMRRNYIDGVYSDCEFIPADKLDDYKPE